MRTRIVDEAHRLFARRGVDGVSIAEVALAAGVSKANVMHHFGSKDGLYAACLDVIEEHLHAAADSVADSGDPVVAVGDAIGGWADRHPDDLRVMAYGLLRLPERDGRWALRGPFDRFVEHLGGDRIEASAVVVDLLGTVTYREMARPIIEAHRDIDAHRDAERRDSATGTGASS